VGSQQHGAQQLERFLNRPPRASIKQQRFLGAQQQGSQQLASQPQLGSQPHEGAGAQQVGSQAGAQQVGSQQQAGSQQAGAQHERRLNIPPRASSKQQRLRGAQQGSQHTGSATQQLGSQPHEGSQPQVGSQHDGAALHPQPPPSKPKNALAFDALPKTMATPKQSVAPKIR